MRVVLLHTAPVFASDGGMSPRLRPPLSMGFGGQLGNGRQWIPWIRLDGAAGLINFFLRHADC